MVVRRGKQASNCIISRALHVIPKQKHLYRTPLTMIFANAIAVTPRICAMYGSLSSFQYFGVTPCQLVFNQGGTESATTSFRKLNSRESLLTQWRCNIRKTSARRKSRPFNPLIASFLAYLSRAALIFALVIFGLPYSVRNQSAKSLSHRLKDVSRTSRLNLPFKLKRSSHVTHSGESGLNSMFQSGVTPSGPANGTDFKSEIETVRLAYG